MIFGISSKVSKNLRKLFIPIVLLFFLFSHTVILPMQRTNAMVWAGAIPAGITLGGGAYALGAIAVGSVATTIGIEYGDEIINHAEAVWNGSTELANKSLHAGMQAAVDTGNWFQNLGNDFMDWTESQAGKIAGAVAIGGHAVKQFAENAANAVSNIRDGFKIVDGSAVPTTLTVSTAYPEVLLTYENGGVRYPVQYSPTYYDPGYINLTLSFPAGSTEAFAFTSNATDLIQFRSLTVRFVNGELTVYGHRAANDLGTNDPLVWNGEHTDLTQFVVSTYGLSTSIFKADTFEESVQFISAIGGVSTVEDVLEALSRLGLDNINIGGQELWEKYVNTAQQILNTDLPAIRSGGLALPMDGLIPRDRVGGAPVTYLPETDSWANQDGTPFVGTPTYDVPKTRVVPVNGVPTLVTPKVGNPAIPNNPPYVDTKTGNPVTPDPPSGGGGGGGSGSTPKFNLTPLIFLGGLIKEKFPFSIPWDVYKLFGQLNVDPITPKFEIDSGEGVTIGGKKINVNYNFDIDFSVFDPIAKIIRWGLILIFDIAIVLALRRLTPD